jgi:hypothetical protein
VDSFERKLEEAQRDMGMASDSFLSVKYGSEVRCLPLAAGGGLFWSGTRHARRPQLVLQQPSCCGSCA